jgi:DNA-binding beta-propeller fold protein YncE
VFVVHPIGGVQAQIEVGQAPWGVAPTPGPAAFVATAEGVAVVDLRAYRRVALIPYQAQVGAPRLGEYRPGGMGIVASPDGRFAFVGVYLASGPSQLEVIDAQGGAVVGGVPIGIRPFQILAAPDGSAVYSVDHDSFTLSVVDTSTLATRTLALAPLGRAAFDKPHYAVQRADGRLLLPFQGRVLVELDPVGGASSTRPLTSNTHQHGAALSADGGQLLIVGTGPAGSANGPAALTQLDLSTGAETHLPLRRTHERVAVSADGRWAYLTGGYTFADGGWDGLTVIDLWQQTVGAELAVPERPLDIVVLPAGAQP